MEYETYNVVKKLAGEIQPVGETYQDDRRFENLKETVTLVELLLADIIKVTKGADRVEYSIQRAGKYAKEFLSTLDFN